MSALAPSYPTAGRRNQGTHATTRSEGPRFISELNLRRRYIDSGHIAGRFSHPLEDINAKLRSMETWADGWNGYAAKAPTEAAIENAWVWISRMYSEVVKAGKPWRNPFVTADVDGEVLLEWRAKTKSLFIYIDEDEAMYIKDLGPEVGSEMEDGDASTSRTRNDLWAWVTK